MFTRLLYGVELGIIDEFTHASEHVVAVRRVLRVRARWLGYRLMTELDIAVAGDTTVRQAEAIAAEVKSVLADHVPALASAHVRVPPAEGAAPAQGHAGHHHAPEPVPIRGDLAQGIMEIIDTPMASGCDGRAGPAVLVRVGCGSGELTAAPPAAAARSR